MKLVLTVPFLVFASLAQASTTTFAPLNVKSLHDEEVSIEKKGEAPRFAIPHAVSISPSKDAAWEKSGNDYVWSHRFTAPNAVSLNFGFSEFRLPEGARLDITSADGSQFIRSFTSEDNNVNNELWTPVILSDDVIVTLTAPAQSVSDVRLTIGTVGQGFRKFSESTQKSGSCNVDVACTDSRGWEKEINSVAVISTGGSTFCTGFMVNNTANDGKPLFMTAAHCRITAATAPSLVAYWNYQASSCRGPRDGRLDQFTTGAVHLATFARSDFTIVKFNQAPRPEFGVRFAGWDRSGADATKATAIHQPSTDEKAISFETDGTDITSYGGSSVPGDGTHVRVPDWNVGTTEPGSSGSPLFDQNHRVIGQLHGGGAACGNDQPDFYGRLFTSWEGGGTAATALKTHLDPINSGAMAIDTL